MKTNGSTFRRLLGSALALLLGAVTAGCTTEVSGTAHTSVCATHRLSNCRDFTPTKPANNIMRVWMNQGARTAGAMLCSTLDTNRLDRLMGEGNEYYRYLTRDQSKACRITTEQSGPDNTQRFSISLKLFAQPMHGYKIVDGNKRTTVAGHPAWVNHQDRGARHYVEYTIATGTMANAGGVLFVKAETDSARGLLTDEELDYSHMNSTHKAIAKAYTKALFG
ncbi:hypothetical protein SAMN04487820_108198 [Actinopolyspora mzabensis]|uniref:Lipoprotein n=1 Tax=Actinopolyspora mzabensis TaxID=995066 RepID=A0A1G9C9N7_ACTMZ|nr:hypothetical protein [Actinopolyspora mzabensis]SDK48382.1 hypothetical protein SAMN04487820_108198 [Actinopolyspora mzabensis]